jgi:hypothetical protein
MDLRCAISETIKSKHLLVPKDPWYDLNINRYLIGARINYFNSIMVETWSPINLILCNTEVVIEAIYFYDKLASDGSMEATSDSTLSRKGKLHGTCTRKASSELISRKAAVTLQPPPTVTMHRPTNRCKPCVPMV